MATKNISITEEAYMRLAALRKDSESFSIVINRITGKHSLAELFGVLSEDAAMRLDESLARVRKSRETPDRERRKRMEEAFA